MKRTRIVEVGTKIVVSILVLSMMLCTATLPALAAPDPSASVSPASQTVDPGDTFSIDIFVNTDNNGVSGGQFDFAFDASVMQVDSVTAGDLFGATPNAIGPDIDNVAGTASLALARTGLTTPPTPNGTFATITLTMNGDAPLGTYTLDITNLQLSDENFAGIAGIAMNDGTVTIEDETPPTYADLVTVPASPTTYVPGQIYAFVITIQDNVAVDTVVFEFDGVNHTDITNIDSAYSYQFTDLAAGTYNYRWYMNDTSDNWNSTSSQSYVINKAATTVNLLLNGTDGNVTIDYGEPVNMSATLSISDTVTLYVDGLDAGSGIGYVENVTTLGVGVHNITASYPGNGNYTAASETHWLTVETPPDEIPPTYSNLVAVPTSPTTYVPGQIYTFNITVQDNVAVDTVVFEFDGVNHTDVTNIDSAYSYQLTDLAAGTYNYRWYMNDTSDNWNSTSSQSYVINKAATTVNLLLNGTDGNVTIDYGEPVNMSATLSISDTVTLYVDGLDAGSGIGYVENVTTLGLGVHNITASYPGNGNYTASSETHWLTVETPRWDVNEDGTVNYIDLAILSAHWLETTTEPYPRYDINGDGTVDYIDLAMLSAHWLETYE
jgi:hypothetical protein